VLEWKDLAAAFALYLVLEGLIPFFNPGAFKRFVLHMVAVPDSKLRSYGLFSMIAGVILLYVVR
jgi:uncharacterized protein YjeT (DUF2065 family)